MVGEYGAGEDVPVAGEVVEALAFAWPPAAGDVLAVVVDADVPGGASASGSAADADVPVGPEACALVGGAYDSADVADEASYAWVGVVGGVALRVGAGDEPAEGSSPGGYVSCAGPLDAVEGDSGAGEVVG